MRLAGKNILIAAAGQGIGRAIAIAATAQGAKVTATDVDASLLTDLDVADTGKLDVTNRDEIDHWVARSTPDVLIYCAGHVHDGTILEATAEDYAFASAINTEGAFQMMQAVLPGMIGRGTGSIITISSVVSSIMGVPNRCIYGATKASQIGLVKSVARDFVDQGIRCNCICPGTVDSPSLQQRLADTGDYDAARAAFVARQPMGRIGQTEEIAELAVYLASDASAYMTGQAIVIDGGMSL